MSMAVTWKYPAGPTGWEGSPFVVGPPAPPTPPARVVASSSLWEVCGYTIMRLLRGILSCGVKVGEFVIEICRLVCGGPMGPDLPAPTLPAVRLAVPVAQPVPIWGDGRREAEEWSRLVMGPDGVPHIAPAPTVESPAARPTPAVHQGSPGVASQRRSPSSSSPVSGDSLAVVPASTHLAPRTSEFSGRATSSDALYLALHDDDADMEALLERLRGADARAAANLPRRDDIYRAAAAEWRVPPTNLLRGRDLEILLAVATRELRGSLATSDSPRARLFGEVLCWTARAAHPDPANRVEWFARFVAVPTVASGLDVSPVRGLFTEAVGGWFAELPGTPVSRGVSVILTCWESAMERCVDPVQLQGWTDQLRVRMSRADDPRRSAHAAVAIRQLPPPTSVPSWGAVLSGHLQRAKLQLDHWLNDTPRLGLPAPRPVAVGAG